MPTRQPASSAQSQVLLDLPGLPVSISPSAEAALQRLPKKGLKLMTERLAAWSQKAPVSAAKALYYVDHEDPDLRYVLLEFLLTPPTGLDLDEQAEFDLKVGGDLSSTYASALEALPERDKKRLFEGLTVGVAWPDDWAYTWGDTSAT